MLSPEVRIARLLRRLQSLTGHLPTIGTCESASGGRIADKITNIAGSSDYFAGSVVSYSNDVKMRLLGVKKATLEKHGAVSRQTAIEMAEGGRKLLKVDICISDTGIAGPGGATPRKPVGLFHLGLATADASYARKHVFSGNRERNKRQAVRFALTMLYDYLKKRTMKAEKALSESHVVTSFLEHKGKVLILRRSARVGSYQGCWSGVSGYLEAAPETQARREIKEEVGIGAGQLAFIKRGRPVEVIDTGLGKRWIVHPFLFRVRSPEVIRLDWENVEAKWITPAQLARYETVPGLKEALDRVWAE